MAKATKFWHIFFVGFIILFLLLIYKEAIFGDKIILGTNYLAHFFSPWSTQKFSGWEHGIPNKPLGTDLLRFFYPLVQAKLTLWNPYIFSGNPQLANFQSALSYPLTWLGNWNLLIVSQPFLATMFCFLFLRALKLTKFSQMLGAMAFGFSGFVVTWSGEAVALGHAALWLPLVFLGLEKRSIFIPVLALVMSIFAGYLQITVYIFIFAGIYSVWRWRNFKYSSVVFVLPLLITTVQLVPSFEAFLNSARPTANIDQVFNTYLLSTFHLVKTIAPDITGHPGSYNFFGLGSYNETSLYIGVIPLIFALIAVRDKRAKFFALGAIFTFVLTSNLPGIKSLLTLPLLPLIPTFQPSRILLLTTFSLSVMAAFGLDNYLLTKSKKIRFIPVVLIIILVITLVYYKFTLILPRDFLVTIKNSVLPFGFLVVFLGLTFLKSRRFFLGLVFGLTVVSQYYFFSKYLVLGEKEFLYPSHPVFSFLQNHQDQPWRFVAFGSPIKGNFASLYKVYSPEGFDPIYSSAYGQLVSEAKGSTNSRIEITLSELADDETLASNAARLKLLTFLGVKYLPYFEPKGATLSAQAIFPPDKFIPVATMSGWTVFENKEVLPRAFFIDPGQAKITSYLPTRVEIQATTPQVNKLILSDNFYPGWKAYVDGIETKIYRADFAFRAVLVPEGDHTVVFKYEPLSLKIGAVISGITLAVTIGLLILRKRGMIR